MPKTAETEIECDPVTAPSNCQTDTELSRLELKGDPATWVIATPFQVTPLICDCVVAPLPVTAARTVTNVPPTLLNVEEPGDVLE